MSWTRQSLATLLLGVAGASAGAQNLLANPGFEGPYVVLAECANVTGEVAAGWNDNTCFDPAQPQVQYAREATGGPDGSTAQRVSLLAGHRAQFVQYLSAQPPLAQKLRASVRLRAASALPVTVLLRQSGPPYAVVSSRLVTLGAAWQEVEFDAVSLGSELMLIVLGTQPGTFWIDQASLVAGGMQSMLPQPPRWPVYRNFFGMHLNQLDTPWPAVGQGGPGNQLSQGIGSVRIWDGGPRLDGSGTGAQWSEINGAAGFYDWSGLDARVEQARARNAEVIYVLGGRTPRWASARPDAQSPYGPGQCAEPASDAVWQQWVTAVATRYKGRIRHWELWNEPDLDAFYCGTPERLISLAALTRRTLRAVDPGAHLISPGYSGFGGPAWLHHFLQGGGAAHVDSIGYHFYLERPEDMWHRIATVQATLREHGVRDKPVRNTEQGYYDGEGELDLFPDGQAAAYVARTHLVNWAFGLLGIHYYSWDNERNQIRFTTADRSTLAPAGVAYAQVIAWMSGRTMSGYTIDASGTHAVTLSAKGSQHRVLWNPLIETTFAVPVNWAVTTSSNLAGQTGTIVGNTVQVGPAPILLRP